MEKENKKRNDAKDGRRRKVRREQEKIRIREEERSKEKRKLREILAGRRISWNEEKKTKKGS